MSCNLLYDNVSFTYPDGTRALRHVSFSIYHGEHIALLGPNGAGKSTIMLLANGILLPQEGTIMVGDLEVSSKTLIRVRQRVGLVFQDPDDQLFMTTVFDDVAFGLLNQKRAQDKTSSYTQVESHIDLHDHTQMPHAHDALKDQAPHTHDALQDQAPHTHDAPYDTLTSEEIKQRVEEALQAVGLDRVACKSPQDLSFGQRKRAALATILVMRPDFLILDEPTSNLDPRGRRHMMELLDAIEHTIVLATHDLDLVWELCPRSIIIDEGVIVADGDTRELLRNKDLLEAHGLELPAAVRYETKENALLAGEKVINAL